MKSLPVFGVITALFLISSSFSDHQGIRLPAPEVVSQVNWMSWEEASERSATEKRKFMIDLYTDWCGWCKKMDQATFQQEYISSYINDHFYPVKFNAEMKEDIVFKGKTYSFVGRSGQRGYHELAAEITRGRLGYPTVVFLDEDMEVIQAIAGYRGPEDFEKILSYFAQDYHKKMPWEKYEQGYGRTVPAISKD